MRLLETVATRDFCLFILGAYGVTLYAKLHGKICKCDPVVFGNICVILTYLAIAYILA